MRPCPLLMPRDESTEEKIARSICTWPRHQILSQLGGIRSWGNDHHCLQFKELFNLLPEKPSACWKWSTVKIKYNSLLNVKISKYGRNLSGLPSQTSDYVSTDLTKHFQDFLFNGNNNALQHYREFICMWYLLKWVPWKYVQNGNQTSNLWHWGLSLGFGE